MDKICEDCNAAFESIVELRKHGVVCSPRNKKLTVIKMNNKVTQPNNVNNVNSVNTDSLDVYSVATCDILKPDKINVMLECSPNLPMFVPGGTRPHPTFMINNIEIMSFTKLVDDAYSEMSQWRKNLFKLPTGHAGKSFIMELKLWLDHFNSQTQLSGIALKVFMIIPALLLQKPSQKSKSKEHSEKLEKRLKLWKEGEIQVLLQECRLIQKRLKASHKPNKDDDAKVFSNLILKGKINAALKLLSKSEVGVHTVDEKILKELQMKHPSPAKISEESLYEGPINRVLPSYFDTIDEAMIHKAITLTKGAGGPSHMDAEQYRHILTSKKFKKENKELREQIARLARKLATEVTDPKTLEAYVACRLIPLNKNPGVRPIGVGEILRRLVGKCVGWVLKDDIQEAAGPLQVATGLQNGAEAAIHAMKQIYESDETDAVILIDASNAFNSLNRMAALHNIQILCPQFATILINTYRIPVRMIVYGGRDIWSAEGTTQGDNLAMSFYALGIAPLLEYLRISSHNVKNVCLADDITGAGKLDSLLKWWKLIITEGRKYGYYVNDEKSWLITKNKELLEKAKNMFSDYNIKFTVDGQRHLGAVIGSYDFRITYATAKVKSWCEEMETLCEFSKSQPHAAYAAFCHGEIHKYTYFLRTIPDMHEFIKPLDELITNKFIPTMLQSLNSKEERQLFSLPTKNGGLGIPILSEIAEVQHKHSKEISYALTSIITSQGSQLPDEDEVKSIKAEKAKERETLLKEKIKIIDQTLPEKTLKAVTDARVPGTSSWLSALPLEEYGFNLTKNEFRDAIYIRYGKELTGLPEKCPCGQKFDVTHALNCKKGGFIIIRHNNIRNFEANLLSKVHSDVQTEPPLQPIDGEIINGADGDNARPDIRARGVWRDGQNAFFDVRVTNTNSNTQANIKTEKVLKRHESKKKNANTTIES